MANSPTDKGNNFIKSGMTLITEKNSDYWLKKHKEWKARKDLLADKMNNIVHNNNND